MTPLTPPFTGKHRGVKQKQHNINFVLSLTYLSILPFLEGIYATCTCILQHMMWYKKPVSVDFHQFRKDVFEFGHWGYLGFGMFRLQNGRPEASWKTGQTDKNIRNHTDFVRFHAQLFRMLASPMSTKLFSPNIRPLFWLRKKGVKPCHLHQGLLHVWTYSRKGSRHGMAAKKGPFQYESTLPTINYIPLLRFRGTCVSFSGEYRGKKNGSASPGLSWGAIAEWNVELLNCYQIQLGCSPL